MFDRSKFARLLFVLLVLVSFSTLQAATVFETHAHKHGGPNDHCCPGCDGGHYPFLQATTSVQVASPATAVWFSTVTSDDHNTHHAFTLLPARAPPAA